MKRIMLAGLSLMILSACGETDQRLTKAGSNDKQAYTGANNPHVIKGWTPGDKASWESQMRTRSLTQNEYNKSN